VGAPTGLLELPGVLGVGFGVKERGGAVTGVPAWRVYVREKGPLHALAAAERIPAEVGGTATDVIEKAPTRATAVAYEPPRPPTRSPPASGARIVNARGVPGTLGCMAITPHDGAAVLVSNHHVLFGAGAGEGEPVWLVEREADAAAFHYLGSTRYGRLGTVTFGGVDYHVDCAVAVLDGANALPPLRRTEPEETAGPPAAGTVVKKTGPVTGTTRGVVVDVAYPDVVLIEGRPRAAPGQILVRPAEDGVAFSAGGDSGAILRDERGGMVGLLWGANHRGESIACHIVPVLQVLGIRLAQVTSR
jgi:hypothetical protein